MTHINVTIAKRYSKGSVERLEYMRKALNDVDARGVPGDVVECGVWRGGHVMLARLESPERRCWLYDTYAGMTPAGPHDVKHNGRHANEYLNAKPDKRMSMASLDEVVENFKKEDLYDENKLMFIVGDVVKTLSHEKNLPEKIAVLRLDTDWYESTKKELEILWPLLEIGGYLIVDDWGHWRGAQKATMDYLGRHQPDYMRRLDRVDYTAIGLIKWA